jgi:SNF family Na+-dependent transporter
VPVTFQYLPLGAFFGFLWFGLLFLAAVTSSISMLQPAIAFFEEGFGMGRRASITALFLVTLPGTLLVAWFTKDTVALDVMDFWVGTLMLVVLALFEVVLFAWIYGAERGLTEANRGSDIRIPRLFVPVIRYVCPLFLAAILVGFVYQSGGAQLRALLDRPPALFTAVYMLSVLALFVVLAQLAARRWERERRGA